MSVKRSGLGRNLSALLGTEFVQPAVVGSAPLEKQLKLPLDLLQPGKYQPRQVFDETGLSELADSIRTQGLLQPVVVREVENGRYEIIAGERRWRACRLAGLTELPVIHRQVDDETAMAMALVENLQREDLNAMDQARAMARLHQEFNLTHQQIADLLSKSRAAVSNFLRLMALSPDVMRYLEYGDLEMGHARALLMLDETQQYQVAQLVVARQLSVRETEKLVSRVKENKTVPAPREVQPAHTEAALQTMREHLKTKVVLKPGRAGKGTLVIHYHSEESLDFLMQNILGKRVT